MKTLKTLLFTFLVSNAMLLVAQTPELLNYQAVIRDNVGDILANQNVSFRISILETSSIGSSVYTETHTATTTDTGLASFQIGNGAVVSGIFSSIEWGGDSHFLQIELDDSGGTTYQVMGTSELVSVPYAIHAKTASNVSGLESIDEGNGIGRRLINKPAANYDNIGLNAIDLSHSNSASTIYGASGSYSTAFGRNTAASGNHSTVMGYQTTASGQYATAMGYYSTALGNYSTAIGRATESSSMYSTAMGRNNIGGGSATSWVVTDPLFEVGNGSNSSNKNNALTILKNGTITAPTFDISEITDDKALITKEYGDANYLGGASGSTGLETLDEGNGFGWRLTGVNPNFYGDIGVGSIDLSMSNAVSSIYGATGNNSFASGKLTTASGSTSTAMGFFTTASGDFSTAIGWSTIGLGSFSTAMGQRTQAESYASVAFGRSNVGGGNNATWVETDPLFEIGNGDAIGSIRSNALTVLKNGTITAPSFDIAEITDTKALITKEYADIYYESSGLMALDEGNGNGWRLIGRDVNNYGNIGIEATDFSSNSTSSSTKGATGNYAFTSGRATTASGNYAMSMGYFSEASGDYASAFGSSTLASGKYGTSLGLGTKADAYASLAIGRYNLGGGSSTSWVATDPLFEIGIGASSNTRSNALTIFKDGTITAPALDITEIIDAKALITKEYVDAINTGLEALDEGNGFGWRLVGRHPGFYGNIGLGALDFSSSSSNVSEGATGNYSAALGRDTTASGNYSTAMGITTIASGEYSTALGSSSNASGDYSTALGRETIASGDFSASIGRLTTASGSYSTAMGYETSASGSYTTALGRFNIGGGDSNAWIGSDPLFEIGNGTSNTHTNALTILKNGTITAPTFEMAQITNAKALITKEYADANYSGLQALDEGNGIGWRIAGRDPLNFGNIGLNAIDLSTYGSGSTSGGATGKNSVSMGLGTNSSGDYSFSMGLRTGAQGKYSTSMGSYTTASGDESTAMGYVSTASGDYSTAMGYNNKAESHSVLAIGRYNIGGGDPDSWYSSNPLFEVGNGSDINNRENAFTILKSGKIGIETATPQTQLQITGGTDATLASITSGYLLLGETYGANLIFDTNEIMARYNGNTADLLLQHEGGDVRVGGSLVHSSDRRLKKDIQDLSYGLDEILQLAPKSYFWKNRDNQTNRSLGLIAQEVQPIIKELVTSGGKDDMLAVNYTELIPVLINAIQEQQEIIDSQQNVIKELTTNETNTNALLSELLDRVKTIENRDKL